MAKPEAPVFPLMYSFEGGVSEDGSAFLVEGTSFGGEVVRFALPLDNIQHLVAFLLIWARNLSPNEPLAPDDNSSSSKLPIPATSIAVGFPEGGEAYIGISVGLAELVFSLPTSALEPVGQSLILAGAPTNAKAI